MLTEEDCSGIVFAETSVLSGDAKLLADARRVIAGIAYKRDGGGCAPPQIPTADDLANPNTKRIWKKCQEAAALAAKDDVKACKHFVIWYSDDKGHSPAKKPKELAGRLAIRALPTVAFVRGITVDAINGDVEYQRSSSIDGRLPPAVHSYHYAEIMATTP